MISFTVKQSGHVRRFLLVAADVRHEVGFLEAVQDNVAADGQEHNFGTRAHRLGRRSHFGQCMIRFLCDGALGAASNNVVKEYSRPTATSFAMRHEPLGDSRLSPQAHVMVIPSNHEVEVV